MEGADPAIGVNTFGAFMTIDMKPRGAGVEITAGVLAAPVTSKHRSFQIPDTAHAPVHLETDGERWIERDGPSQLFGAMGTERGLVLFFPDLPRADTPADWSIARPRYIDVVRVEASRGSREGRKELLDRALASRDAVDQPAQPPTRARVRFERWTEEHGARVAELSMTASEDGEQRTDLPEGMGSMAVHAASTMRGAYLVTPNGRLLHAKIERESRAELTTDPARTQHYVGHARLEMSLVGACDGPTEPSLATPLDREERAVARWGEAFVAIVKGQREAALAAFDPALRKKHGDARLWDALVSYRAARSERALPPPLLLRDKDFAAEGASVRVTTHGTTPTPSGSYTPLDMVVELREVDRAWLVQSIRADLVLENQENLLEIGRDRVVVRTGWPPR
jgi:hypothetical protein